MEAENKIRILQSVGAMNHGGIEHYVMNLYRAIDKDRVQFDFMYRVSEPCVFDDEIRGLGGIIYRCPSPDRHPLRARKYYRAFFAEHPEYKVIHEHRSTNSGFYGLLRAAQRSCGSTRIVHSHSSMPLRRHGTMGNKVELATIRMNTPRIGEIATDYIACSDVAADWLFPETVIDRDKVVIAPNGINVDNFAYDRSDRALVREKLGIPYDALVIGHVGRFQEAKNHAFLVELLKSLIDGGNAAYLLLVGDGALRQDIEEKVASLGLVDNVVFAGLQSNPASFYSAMDVFCMPSLYEGLPVSCVEAQASGLPLVLSAAVSRQADLTGRVDFLALKSSRGDWEKAILGSLRTEEERFAGQAEVKLAGFDISNQAKWFERFYTCKYFNRNADRLIIPNR